jgi:hypothetical protein
VEGWWSSRRVGMTTRSSFRTPSSGLAPLSRATRVLATLRAAPRVGLLLSLGRDPRCPLDEATLAGEAVAEPEHWIGRVEGDVAAALRDCCHRRWEVEGQPSAGLGFAEQDVDDGVVSGAELD